MIIKYLYFDDRLHENVLEVVLVLNLSRDVRIYISMTSSFMCFEAMKYVQHLATGVRMIFLVMK